MSKLTPDRPPRPSVWPAFVAYTAAFVLLVAADAALLAVPVALATWTLKPSRSGTGAAFETAETVEACVRVFGGSAFGVACVSAMNATVLATLAAFTQAFGPTRDLRRELRLVRARVGPFVVAVAVVGFWGLALACGAFASLVGVGESGTLGFLDQVFRGASPAALAFAAIGIGIFPGVGEEAFFRGMMLMRLRGRLGTWPAIAVTAVTFGVIHLDVVQGTFAVLLGLYLGWLVERTGSVVPAMIAHALNNAFFVFAAGFSTNDEPTTAVSRVALAGGGLAASAFGVWLVRHKTRADPASSTASA